MPQGSAFFANQMSSSFQMLPSFTFPSLFSDTALQNVHNNREKENPASAAVAVLAGHMRQCSADTGSNRNTVRLFRGCPVYPPLVSSRALTEQSTQPP